ncbi:hypothetical protein GWP57_11480 [Gammaproteobacteria bacterium]|nr:hypothetical protein [Gammaproteobacteria bacterium]
MSSDTYSTELTPEPSLRRLVLASGSIAALIGIGVIISIPVHWALRLAATGAWIFASVRELVIIYHGHRRYRRIRLYSPGQISLQTTAGDWQAAELISGSIVLPGVAWLRMRTHDGRRHGELLIGKVRGDDAWRRFQVIWRHLGTAR